MARPEIPINDQYSTSSLLKYTEHTSTLLLWLVIVDLIFRIALGAPYFQVKKFACSNSWQRSSRRQYFSAQNCLAMHASSHLCTSKSISVISAISCNLIKNLIAESSKVRLVLSWRDLFESPREGLSRRGSLAV